MMIQPFSFTFNILRLLLYLLPLCIVVVTVALALGSTSPKRVLSYVTSADYVQKVHIIDVGLGITHKVSDMPVFGCCPIWSPDGNQIAFNSMDNRSYSINIFRGDDQPLNTAITPLLPSAWSPDGSSLILRWETGGAELYAVDADGDNFRSLTENVDDSWMPVWSPDGRYIVFVKGEGFGKWDIYRMDSDGSNVQPLTMSAGENNMFPAISPDSQRVVFVSDRDGNQELYLMNIDGSNLQRLTQTTAYEMQPQWSPDETKILVTAQPMGLTSGDIYVIDLANGKPYQLVQHGSFIFSAWPSWSPDGGEIAFIYQNEYGDPDIYVADADGGNLRQLTDNPDLDSFPAWQP